uniref:Uncharacterized protein n=1 Tax=Mycobacterium riyadhense TaxID=486698 RepID=A0A653F002_9MYCO|nr:hypothetical protein BIN_B_04446 [Mycobacterium riyadhense]
MKQPLVLVRVEVRAFIAAEIVAAATAFALLLTGCGLVAAIAAGIAWGLLWCVLSVAGLTPWQWARLGVRWWRHRQRRLMVIDRRPAPKDQEPADV